ncbi:MAG: hypothetical protein HC933_05400 [Pleurocapsa sp. SU_196_0]|nr:hypothetical protein [Pleurocapsa sp. SU_196_0]
MNLEMTTSSDNPQNAVDPISQTNPWGRVSMSARPDANANARDERARTFALTQGVSSS